MEMLPGLLPPLVAAATAEIDRINRRRGRMENVITVRTKRAKDKVC